MGDRSGGQTGRIHDVGRPDGGSADSLRASRRRLASWLADATPAQVRKWRAYDATPRTPLFRRYATEEQIDWTLETSGQRQRRRKTLHGSAESEAEAVACRSSTSDSVSG